MMLTRRRPYGYMNTGFPPPSQAPLYKHPLHYPFEIKNEILRFKKYRSGGKEISFLFYMFFFHISTNNTKKIICLKSKTCHYCQSLIQTGSIDRSEIPVKIT